jgi:hypothetical protein
MKGRRYDSGMYIYIYIYIYPAIYSASSNRRLSYNTASTANSASDIRTQDSFNIFSTNSRSPPPTRSKNKIWSEAELCSKCKILYVLSSRISHLVVVLRTRVYFFQYISFHFGVCRRPPSGNIAFGFGNKHC